MITKNGFRFGVGVFVICVTMLMGGQLSASFSGKGGNSAGIEQVPGTPEPMSLRD